VGSSQRELCDALDLDRSTIADLGVRLQSRGLVRRVRATEDKRRNVLELTHEGRQVFLALVLDVRRVGVALTDGIREGDVTELYSLLNKLLDARLLKPGSKH
jgi:DNA-binding MarR family transcriptional regulator